jgi:integrase/recombinase XerD
MSVTVNVFLDTRRSRKKTSTYPVKLRVTFDRKPLEYQTVFDLTSEEYNKLGAPRITDRLKEIRDKLKNISRNASNVAKELDPFTFEEFEKDYILNNPLFHQRKAIKRSVLPTTYCFDRTLYEHRFPIFKETDLEQGRLLAIHLFYIDKLLQEHRIGTAVSYQTSYYSFFKFRGNIRLTEVTTAYLHQYETWMFSQDYSKTTIGIYTRQLRTLFNEAIEQGLIKKEKHYPFGRRKYVPPTGRNVKKALTIQDVAKLYYYQPECKQEQWGKDFWFFSYLANGINTKDIALLKYRNIQGEYLVFERAKTEKSTRTDPRPISVFISEDLQQIINRWGNKDRNPNNYLFPILSPGITPMRQYELIELFVASINDWMRKIKKKVGIDRNVTCYVARHTFSTVMKRSGASTEFIQEALGHTNIKTTENYLDSFEKEVKKEFASKLVSFKSEPLSETV